jgi:hypothetical protein
MGPLGPEADVLHRIGCELLMLALPVFVVSYIFSFLLVMARTWAFSEGRKLWTRPRLLLTVGLVCVLVTTYLHWVLVFAGTVVADLHRMLGVG